MFWKGFSPQCIACDIGKSYGSLQLFLMLPAGTCHKHHIPSSANTEAVLRDQTEIDKSKILP